MTTKSRVKCPRCGHHTVIIKPRGPVDLKVTNGFKFAVLYVGLLNPQEVLATCDVCRLDMHMGEAVELYDE